MLYFYFRPQREPLHMIEVQLSVITYFVIEHVNECYGCYYQSHPLLWLNSIGVILGPNLISSITLAQSN